MFNYISSNITVTAENDNRKENKFAKFTCLRNSNQPPVVYPEMTVVSMTSRSVVLMNGRVIFLVMMLFSFEHG